MSSFDITVYDGQTIKDSVKQAYLGKPIERPVKLTIRVISAVPRSYSDNHAEACLAGLEWPSKILKVNELCRSLVGLVYKSDKQVAVIDAAKIYGSENKIDIKVEELCY